MKKAMDVAIARFESADLTHIIVSARGDLEGAEEQRGDKAGACVSNGAKSDGKREQALARCVSLYTYSHPLPCATHQQELELSLAVSRAMHEMLSPHLHLDAYEELLSESNASVTSAYGRITLHVFAELCTDIIPNHCYCTADRRCVLCLFVERGRGQMVGNALLLLLLLLLFLLLLLLCFLLLLAPSRHHNGCSRSGPHKCLLETLADLTAPTCRFTRPELAPVFGEGQPHRDNPPRTGPEFRFGSKVGSRRQG